MNSIIKRVLSLILCFGFAVSSLSVGIYAASCTNGHSIEQKASTVTKHKVYESGACCLRNVYTVETCTRNCGYVKETLVSSGRIYCQCTYIYRDVTYGKWYSRAVLYNKRKAIMKGDTLFFRPEDSITRAEFVTVLSRMTNATTSIYKADPFSDVDINSWYGKAVAWAKGNDIVNGYNVDSFGPDDPITREQMCVILANLIDRYHVVLPEGEDKTFADADEISCWAKDPVAECAGFGIVSGMEHNSFRPSEHATRAQIARLIYNLNRNIISADFTISEPDIPIFDSGIPDNSNPLTFDYMYFDSVAELADMVNGVSDEELFLIFTAEERVRGVNAGNTLIVSDEEFENGIFATFVKNLREKNAVLYPFVNGERAELVTAGDRISLHPSNLFKRPEITYNTKLFDSLSITYLDPELCKEAEEKGASWLIRALDEDALNVHNYETSSSLLTVYEKEYVLGDRTVNALVYDYHNGNNEGMLTVSFVYGDALVRIVTEKSGAEAALAALSLVSVSI